MGRATSRPGRPARGRFGSGSTVSVSMKPYQQPQGTLPSPPSAQLSDFPIGRVKGAFGVTT